MIVAKHSDWKSVERERADDPLPLPCIACKGRKMVALPSLPAPNELGDPLELDLRWCAACDGSGLAAEGFEWRPEPVKAIPWWVSQPLMPYLDHQPQIDALKAAFEEVAAAAKQAAQSWQPSTPYYATSNTTPIAQAAWGQYYVPVGSPITTMNTGWVNVLGDLVDAIPSLRGASAKCPCSRCAAERWHESRPVMDLIPHLNDSARWSREQIADWLETLDVDLTFQPREEVA